MQPEALREARDWIARAERDVLIAERALEVAPILPEMAAYHAQQAAEKALKAFLTAHDAPFQRTHELVPLLAACLKLDPTLRSLLGAAQTLSPYATRFRYPGGPLEPTVTEAEEALRFARQVLELVRKLLGV
jgi:HEPN domain-containing protein